MRTTLACLLLLVAAGCGDDTTGNGDGGKDAFVPTDGGSGGDDLAQPAGPSVLQHHNHATRDGVYVIPQLTKAAAAQLHQLTSFAPDLPGQTYAQPLFVENGPGGKDALVAATEQNVVWAFDAASGAVLWKAGPLGAPVALSDLPCGNIDPLGVTGTPVIDLAARTIYLDAMTTPDGGTTKRHLVFALSLDDGSVRSGWPVDVGASAMSNGISFKPEFQGERGALALLGDTLYVPFGGHYGDCGDYHGWVVGIRTADRAVTSWATPAGEGGIWAPAGVSSDGANLFATTGNTLGATGWMGGEAMIRFQPGPVFSGQTADYYAPSNWMDLDAADKDLGGSAAILVDVPGANPSRLAVATGKDQKVYLLDRDNLGGIGGEIAQKIVATDEIIGAAAAYHTGSGTYVAMRVNNGGGMGCPNGGGGNLVVVKIGAASPPTIDVAWCSDPSNMASPMVTTTDGTSEAIVWDVDANAGVLYGFDGDTGQVVFAGGGPSDQMSGVHYFQSPIAAKGRIYVAGDKLYAFSP